MAVCYVCYDITHNNIFDVKRKPYHKLSAFMKKIVQYNAHTEQNLSFKQDIMTFMTD
jgi:hypothetical protein